MTKTQQNGPITVNDDIRDVLRSIHERINRELRYSPELNGETAFTLVWRNGQIHAIKVQINDSQLARRTT